MKRKLLVKVVLVLSVLVCAFGLFACGNRPDGGNSNNSGNSQNGTESNATISGMYLFVKGDVLDQTDYLIFEGKSWSEGDDIAGPYEIKGKKITLYFDIDGEKVEYKSGNINGDDIKFEDNSVYRKTDLTEKPKTLEYKLSDDGSHYVVTGAGGMTGEVTIPDTYKKLPVTEIADTAFANNGTITKLIVPESVTKVGRGVFAMCSALEEVDIRGAITEIETLTFYTCNNLETVRIPKSVKKFAKSSFSRCDNLVNVYFGGTASDWAQIEFAVYSQSGEVIGLDGSNPISSSKAKLFIDNELAENITITAEKVNVGAFLGYKRLKSVSFQDSYQVKLTSIGTCAFSGCSGLESVNFGNSSVSVIGTEAFSGCSSLKELKLPATICSIGESAFDYCSSLTEADLGEVEYIEDEAFYGCENLTSLSLGSSLVEIGHNAFYGCKKLIEVTIPSSVIAIGAYAFGNTGLSSATIGSTDGWKLTNGDKLREFYDRDNLSDPANAARFLSKIERDLGYADYNWEKKYKLIYTLNRDGESYSVNSGSGLKGNIVIPRTYKGKRITSIEWNAFAYCSSLTSITIPDSVTSIGNSAFAYCSSLTSIYYTGDIASWCGISGLGNLTASGRTLYIGGQELTGELVIPDGVTSIGSSAFSSCSKLTSITIPNSVTSIGNYAFYGCSSLTSITIPYRVTSIGEGAFSGCGNLETLYWNAMACMNAGLSNSPIFKDCNKLKTVIIGNNVKAIPHSAFSGCSSLENITIPDSVTSIGDGVFSGCSGLTSITIPDSVTSIGSNALFGCSSLESITIPFVGGGIKSSYQYYPLGYIFGATSYTGSTAIEQKYYGSGTSNPSSTTYYYMPSRLKSVAVTGGYILYGAFYNCSSLMSITLGDRVTSIGGSAFYNCSSLTSITIPNSVTSIGYSAFYGCSGLKAVYITDIAAWCKIPFGNSNANPLYYAHNLYLNNELATNLVIPDSVTSIGSYTFYNCSSLTSVTIPDSVTNIGSWAFNDCSSLESITVNSENLNYSSQDGILYNKEKTEFIYIPKAISGTVTIPNNITSIGDSAFYGCGKLMSITIPESVTSIGKDAFRNCSSLTSITIPNNITSIGDYAFRNCSSLTSITIPNNITSIGNYAFSGCSSLTSVTIPDSVTSIGSSAFSSCSKLTSITIPNSVTSIGNYAFYGCSSLETVYWNATACTSAGLSYLPIFSGCSKLTTVIIGDNVSIIPSYAFEDCRGLTSITIGNSVTSIGDSAFEDCSGLYYIKNCSELILTIGSADYGKIAYYAKAIENNSGNIVYKDNSGAIENDFLFTIDSNGDYTLVAYLGQEDTITLPSDIFGKSYSISRMSGVKNVIIPNSVTSIGQYAFYNCSSLESVTIPNSVISIGQYAFYNCSSLTSVAIPNGVTSIELEAFSSCSNLSSITIPASVTSIDGNGAFRNCISLASITVDKNNKNYHSEGNCLIRTASKKIILGCKDSVIPNDGSVTSIGKNAFYGCSSLTSITIPESVTNIEDNAFMNCNKLTSITIPDSVTSIGNYTFTGCYNLQYNEYDNALYLGNSNNPYVALIKAKDKNIASCNIYSSTKVIYASAFEDCSSLTSITIPDSVTSIGYRAFSDCSSLESVTIGNSVTSIGYRAFSDCSKLTSVTFINISGWYVTKARGASRGTTVGVTSSSQNATYLKSTYCDYYWYRK